MSSRTKTRNALAIALVLPVVASVGLTAAAPSSGAASSQQAYNGGFDAGRAGWALTTRRTKMRVVQAGVGGTRAMKLTKRRPGPAGTRSRAIRSSAAGQKYAVSAWVRTNQPGALGALALRESASGKSAVTTKKVFRASRSWSKVSLTAVTRRSASALDVSIFMPRLNKRKSILIDGVSVLRVGGTAGGSTTPRPSSPKPPPPPMPPPTEGTPGKMSNGCAISSRGLPVPSCGSLLGSAYGSNTDPAAWEKEMGHRLGVRRTYYGASHVDKAVSVSKADLAMDRIPWISFKLPYGWADMAAGKGDAWTRDLAVKLSKLDGPVWLAFHHEPEGDGDIKLWTAMQARLAPIVRSAASNVSYSIVLTGWNQLYGSAQYRIDALWPKNTKIDLLGVDVYNKYGAVSPDTGKMHLKYTDMNGAYFKPFGDWAKKNGVAWGVAETGITDKASADNPQLLQQTYTSMKNNGGVAFTYFNTTLNSVASWALTPQSKKNQFAAVLRATPTI